MLMFTKNIHFEGKKFKYSKVLLLKTLEMYEFTIMPSHCIQMDWGQIPAADGDRRDVETYGNHT